MTRPKQNYLPRYNPCVDERHGTLSEREYTPKLAGLDDLGSSLITLTVSLGQYRENLRAILDLIRPAEMIAVVKANAYGFGAEGLVPILSEFDTISLGVANADEALELKAAGYPGTIILLGYTHPKNYYQIVHSRCQLAAYRPENIPHLAAACKELEHPLELHIKVDTGMSRLGVAVDELAEFIRTLKTYPQIAVVGLFSHMVDSGTPDAESNAMQAELFRKAIDIAESELGYRPKCHLANSEAVLNFPDLHLDSVRVGLLAYGVMPSGKTQAEHSAPVRPCFKLASEVIDLHHLKAGQGVSYGHVWRATRDTKIATLPFGYADGLFPSLSNAGEVLIGGRWHPLVGRVTMDYVMADVGDHPVSIGDEAVFVGRQGEAEIELGTLARLADCLPYELTCAWGRRVRRVYVE